MANLLYDLSGQVAIITGETSIANAIALEIAGAGGDISLANSNPASMKELAKQILNIGRKCLITTIDVTQAEQVNNMIESTLREMGRIDILVNNIETTFKAPAEKICPKIWKTNIDINLTGTFLCCRAVFNTMAHQKKGVIINIVSIAGRDGAPGNAHYGAAQAGVINLTLSLASEWGKHGIRVNCIIPGFIETEKGKQALDLIEVQNIPLGRWGQPEEVSRAVHFIVSKAAGFITGALLDVDGGPRTGFHKSLWGE